MDDELPQTEQVFDAPELVINQHEWIQQGYYITDVCSPKKLDCYTGGIPIPYGKMLIRKDGRYDLTDESR
jgi:hypothetical protein